MDNRQWESGASATPPAAPATPSVGYPSDGDPAGGVEATTGGAFWFHQIGESLRNIITRVGRTPDHTDLNLLGDSIQDMIEARVGDYALDTGTADAKVVALDPVIAAYTASFSGTLKVAVTNTGACTLDAGGGAKALVNGEGAALVAGDLPAGAVVHYHYVLADDKFYVTSLVPSLAVTAAEDPTGADNSTRIATTGWVRSSMLAIATAAGFAISLAGSGYIKFPTWLGGLVLQWGSVNFGVTGNGGPFSFPIAFPNVCFVMMGNDGACGAGYSSGFVEFMPLSTTQFQGYMSSGVSTAHFFAIGH